MKLICRWLKMCATEMYLKMNYHICSIIYWILLATKKYWSCIKGCAGDICIHIRIVLNFTLKHMGICGKMKKNNLNTIFKITELKFIAR